MLPTYNYQVIDHHRLQSIQLTTYNKTIVHHPSMAFRNIVRRALLTPVLLVTFLGYVGAACLAGWTLNHNLDSGSANSIGNNVTPWMLQVALIACMVGIASTFPGFHHLAVWRSDTLAAAAASALIAWLLTVFAMLLVVKQHIIGGGNRPLAFWILEFLIWILSGLELLYFLLLHAFFRHGHEVVGYHKGPGVLPMSTTGAAAAAHHHRHHSKPDIVGRNHGGHVDYGVHTDKKIPEGHFNHSHVAV